MERVSVYAHRLMLNQNEEGQAGLNRPSGAVRCSAADATVCDAAVGSTLFSRHTVRLVNLVIRWWFFIRLL